MKNWTVVTERVKGEASGLAGYQSYLENNNHKNHKKTVIKDITGNSSDFFAFCTKTCLEKDLNLIKAGKGGRRVASYAQGFNLTLPGEFQPSDLQWKKIYFEVRDALKKHLNLTNESFYCNLHEEPTKNSHLNLLVSRCNANAEVNQKLDQRNTVKLVKESFTAAVLKHCSISVENYQKKSKEVKKKRLSGSSYQAKQRIEEQQAKLAVPPAAPEASAEALRNGQAVPLLEVKELSRERFEALAKAFKPLLGSVATLCKQQHLKQQLELKQLEPAQAQAPAPAPRARPRI